MNQTVNSIDVKEEDVDLDIVTCLFPVPFNLPGDLMQGVNLLHEGSGLQEGVNRLHEGIDLASSHAFIPLSVGTRTLDSSEIPIIPVETYVADPTSIVHRENQTRNNTLTEIEGVLKTWQRILVLQLLLTSEGEPEELGNDNSALTTCSVKEEGEVDQTCSSSSNASQSSVSQRSERSIKEFQDPSVSTTLGNDIAVPTTDFEWAALREVLSRKVLVDEGSRQVVEIKQATIWRFLWWSGTISVHVLVDQNREDYSVDYSTVFIFWQLMFVDNKLAAGMGEWDCITDLLHVLKCFPICNKEGEDLSASIGLLSDCEKVVPSKVVVDKDDETLVLVFDEALGVGDGVLEIKFSGVINEHMQGFYKGCNLYFKNALIF
ncbi:hypothetical protein Tco_0842129 [Tanacetum coccineum]|uniref:Uncharacterized protein n=1 Tax=Tanacetum coccineum TaxID=301880 RepID=A0ABQ5B0L1_9ASTR